MTSVQSSEVSNSKLDTISETVNLGCEYEFGPKVEDITAHQFGSSFRCWDQSDPAVDLAVIMMALPMDCHNLDTL